MTEESFDVLPTPSPQVVSRRLGDEVVLVHLQTNRIFSLNETGARLWELLTEERSRAVVEDRLRLEYDCSSSEVTAAVDKLLSDLARERLVQVQAS